MVKYMGSKSEGPVIRPMRKDDFDDVVRIDSQYTGERREEYFKRLFDEVLNSEYGVVISLAAEYDGRVVGFVAGSVFSGEFGIPESVAYLTTIGVDKEFSGKGIGRELFDQFVTNARAIGVKKIYTMVDWGDKMLFDFFRNSGFRPSSTMLTLELEIP
ncbi:GNAT family N-acetyltransferase [Geoglobus acetivorans]|nr:GNAT family N-acetyltransferase [Geoglobus acetivorans]